MENTDIKTIINGIMQFLKKNGFKDSTIKRNYQPGFNYIDRYYRKENTKSADDHFLLKCYEHLNILFTSDKLSRQQFSRYRKCVAVMRQYVKFRTINYEKLPSFTYRLPINDNETILMQFLGHERTRLADTSLTRNGNIIRQFLRYLEDNRCAILHKLSEKTISSFMEYISSRRPAGLCTVAPAIRAFVSYLYNAGITAKDLSPAAEIRAIRRHKIYGIFSNQEMEKILEQIDISTSLGKRNRAILRLASHNGLRSSDILSLKLEDIHWKEAEIVLIQKKTLSPISCPMDTDVGNALADYILDARPASALSNVFLGIHPSQTLSSSALCFMLKKYMSAAGVVKAPKERASMHTFRRTLGTSLLENDVPLETISQVLGHRNTQSTKQYLSISERKLAECALVVSCPTCLREDSND